MVSMKLDETDFKILEFLKKDARKPFTEIGNALEIADSTVHIRVEKMVNEGLIRRFTVDVNDEALGRLSCFLMIDVAPGHFGEVMRSLFQSGNVEEVYEFHGVHFAWIKISAASLPEMREEIIRVRKIPNVTRTEMNVVLKTWKSAPQP
jgi:Lrp/AsnC family transcriptional regulator for asnA, asnC and gidA